LTACPIAQLEIEVYSETDTAMLNDFKTTGRATKKLYDDGRVNYDFSKHRPNPTKTDAVIPFTNIVYRNQKKVAFAFKDDVAVLAYCRPATDKLVTTTTC